MLESRKRRWFIISSHSTLKTNIAFEIFMFTKVKSELSKWCECAAISLKGFCWSFLQKKIFDFDSWKAEKPKIDVTWKKWRIKAQNWCYMKKKWRIKGKNPVSRSVSHKLHFACQKSTQLPSTRTLRSFK